MRIYSAHFTEREYPALNAPLICKDSWSDLEAFDTHNHWLARDVFLAKAEARLANGEHVYTIVENERLVRYGWIAAPAVGHYILEVGQFVEFPADSVYLYDFFTHPEYRNRGFYQSSLQQILRELRTTSAFKEAYIGVDLGNVPSRRAIEKIGFSYCYSLFQEWRWHRVQRWVIK
jgi:RimJ/RimL family protein N-acetyltransferase